MVAAVCAVAAACVGVCAGWWVVWKLAHPVTNSAKASTNIQFVLLQKSRAVFIMQPPVKKSTYLRSYCMLDPYRRTIDQHGMKIEPYTSIVSNQWKFCNLEYTQVREVDLVYRRLSYLFVGQECHRFLRLRMVCTILRLLSTAAPCK